MLNIISIDYQFKFIILIIIIPICITIEDKITFAFLNGINVIRCSDNQIQVYHGSTISYKTLSEVVKCDDHKEIIDNRYAGFLWNQLSIVCSSTAKQVHEEQTVTRVIDSHKGVDTLPEPTGQLGPSGPSYELELKTIDSDKGIFKIKSKDQSVNDYFNGKISSKERTVYIWFEDHPILCRIKFSIDQNNQCSDEGDDDNTEADDVEYACYYNPGSDQEPTIKQLEAEFKQIRENAPDNQNTFVLDLDMPDINAIDPSKINPNSLTPNKPSPHNPSPAKKPLPKTPSSKPKKSPIPKILGVILGILLLLALIAGIGFYMVRNHRLNKSASLANIENGNNQDRTSLSSSTFKPNDDQQTFNEPIKQEKPTIESQIVKTNKRPRTATNMIFNEDM